MLEPSLREYERRAAGITLSDECRSLGPETSWPWKCPRLAGDCTEVHVGSELSVINGKVLTEPINARIVGKCGKCPTTISERSCNYERSWWRLEESCHHGRGARHLTCCVRA